VSNEVEAEREVDAGVCYRHPKRESRVLCQRCGRPICPECQVPAPVGVQCRSCVSDARGAEASGRPSALARAFRPGGSTPVVTYSIMALCAVIWVLQWLTGGALTEAWVLDPRFIRIEPWRLFTSAFLHSTSFVLHIVLNLYALYAFGPALERFLGRLRYLALYLLGALGGSVVQVLIYQAWIVTDGEITTATNGFVTPSAALGASGAIFALMGAVLVMRRALGINLGQLGIVIAANFAITFFARGIAWGAHLGGFLVGAGVGFLFLRTRRPNQRNAQIVGLVGIGLGLFAILVLCVVSAPSWYY
jgi:membrane associated rhomboid family serine protease